MGKIFLALDALKAGESLKSSAAWKNRQLVMNALLIIIGAGLKFGNIEIPETDLNSIAYGLATLGGAVNAYLTAATSEKVGV